VADGSLGALVRKKKKLFEKLLIWNVYLISEEGLLLFLRCNASSLLQLELLIGLLIFL
jgi:hypothetical protein